MRRKGLVGVLLLVVILIGLLAWWSGTGFEFDEPAVVKARFGSSDSLLLDRRGKILHQLRTNEQVRRLQWTELEDISPALIELAVYAEDHRFFKHAGIDWIAVAGSVVQTISGRPRGASTITMQLASILHPELQSGGERRSPAKKLEQMRAAIQLERQWSKQNILEAYLNLVYFRGELQGVRSASWGLFGK
ncbi:MAG TPA: biosynthetic peptidoglycan transglycosylase, partial [Acidobacteriota bacterium]|nr:biosynthetic peptidoglycan transglycosylase [Acidobacteriota bacterium]